MINNFAILKEVKALSPTLADRMAKAVGFRNIAVHGYPEIDRNIVIYICRDHLGDFQ